MLDYLKTFLDIILSIVHLAVMLVQSLFEALIFLPSMISSLTEGVGYLPPILAMFGTLYITFVIINYVLGRQG